MGSAFDTLKFSIQVTRNAHGFAQGNALAFAGNNYFKACGNTVANSNAFVGFCAQVIDANNFILQYDGLITGFAGLNPSTKYYLDPNPVNAGLLTAVYPAGTGQVAKPVLIATSPGSGYIVKENGIVKFPNNKLQYRTGNETYNGVDLLEGNNITITQNGNGDYTITGKLNQTVNEINLPGVNIQVTGGELVFGGVIPVLVPGLSTTQDLNIRSGKTLKWFNTANTAYTGIKASNFSANNTYTLPTAFPSIALVGSAVVCDSLGNLTLSVIPGRNRLLNGDFQWWKRGADGAASFTINNTTIYGPDRWQIKSSDAATTATFTQFPGVTSGSYFIKCQRAPGSAGTGDVILSQSLPRYKCIGMAGNAFNISFDAYIGANFSAAGQNLTIKVFSGTGNNDVSSLTTGFVGSVLVDNSTKSLTGGIVKYNVIGVPLAANVTQLCVEFSFTPTGVAGADDSFYITDIQEEIGIGKTPYERKDETKELERYCWKTFEYGTAPAQGVGALTGELLFPATQAGALANLVASYRHPNIMLNPIVVTTFNPVSANAEFRDETFGGDCSGTIALQTTDKQITFETTGNAGTVVGNVLGIHLLVESELV